MGEDFDYARSSPPRRRGAEADIVEVMTTSQDWWPADYGHYGPLFIRMTWHAAGTYRIADGRGGGGDGAQRFAPLNSWPDNANLDKARRLLWPVKQKYGRKISWADLLVFAGNVALSRWASRRSASASAARTSGSPRRSSGAPRTPGSATSATAATASSPGPARRRADGPDLRQPGGPQRQPRPARRRPDIRETFARMAMNDEETVALIAGGHTFGKTTAPATRRVGPEPEGCPVEQQGLGWKSSFGTARAPTRSPAGSRARGPHPDQWDNSFFETCSATSGS
jgi:catalase-peroxidase